MTSRNLGAMSRRIEKSGFPHPLGEHCSIAVKMWLETASLQVNRRFHIESAVSNCSTQAG
jgi:hypothetical protein